MPQIHTPGNLPSPPTMHHAPLVRRSSRSSTTSSRSAAQLHHHGHDDVQRLPPIVPFTSPLALPLAQHLDTLVIFLSIPALALGDGAPQPWLASKDCTLAQLATGVAQEYGVRVSDIRLFYNGYRYGWGEEVKVGRVKGGGLGMKERDVVYVLIGGR